MIDLKLGISTCPNDTYIFGAMLRGDIKHNYKFDLTMDDVQCLNELAMQKKLDIVKVSFGVFPEIAANYKILKAGGAMGFGCGPLLLSKKYSSMEELRGKKIAIPGKNTSAFMIFSKFYPELVENIIELRFDKIMPAVVDGVCDAGLVIHEGRFVYQNYGLTKLIDLGNLWEEKLNSPIPLGFIAIRKELIDYADDINNTIRRSIKFAEENPSITYEFAKKYAWDMDEEVMRSHVQLYVNEYSFDLTKAGKSIATMLGTDETVFA